MAQHALRERNFWRDFAPGFHIEDSSFLNAPPIALPNGDFQSDLLREGYIHLEALNRDEEYAAMADVARAMSAAETAKTARSRMKTSGVLRVRMK